MSQTKTYSYLPLEEEDPCGNRPLGVNHPNHGSLQQNSNAAGGLLSSITGGIKGPLATSDSLGWSNADLDATSMKPRFHRFLHHHWKRQNPIRTKTKWT